MGNKYKLLIFILIHLFLAGYSVSINEKVVDKAVEGRLYRDINYFTLEGIEELKNYQIREYPYFEIKDSAQNFKILKVKHSANVEFISRYEKKENYWFGRKDYYGDVLRLNHRIKFVYMFEDRRIELVYFYHVPFKEDIPMDTDTLDRSGAELLENHCLYSIEITTENRKTVYNYYDNTKEKGQQLKISPSPTLAKKANDLHFVELFDDDIIMEKGIMIVNEKRIYPKGDEDFYNEKRCYSRIDAWGYEHNVFWNSIFQMGEEIECE